MPDGVRVVWVGLLEEPLEVVCRWPRRTLVAARSSQAASHARATYLPVVTVIIAGHGRNPLKSLLAPLVAAFDTLLCAVGGDVGWCLLVAIRGCLLASPCGAKHDRLIAGDALGGDAVRLLERASDRVIVSVLLRALREMFG
jgi:hypothetical protein